MQYRKNINYNISMFGQVFTIKTEKDKKFLQVLLKHMNKDTNKSKSF